MGIFKSIGRGIKSFGGQVTGKTAARQARRAGQQQAGAIMGGYQAQQRQVAPALREIDIASGAAGGYFSPYMTAGQRAMGALQEAIPGLTEDIYTAPTAEEVAASPAVQFRMQQAQRAAEMGAAARGGLMGGGHQRSLARYMQGLASQEYESEDQRRFREAQFRQQQQQSRIAALQGLTGLGMQGAGQAAGIRERRGMAKSGIRTGSGAAAAAALQAAGQARASGALAGAQARQQAFGQIMGGLGTAGGMALGGPLGGALGGALATRLGGGNPGVSGEMAGEQELPMYGYGYPGMMGGAYG